MILEICKNSRECSKIMAHLSTEKKNEILKSLISKILANQDYIIEKNKEDLENARKEGLSDAFIQRLEINDKVLNEMIKEIKTIMKLEDPVGEVIEEKVIQETMKLKKVRVSLGVVLIIYESRPNVTIDVAAICIKSGNAAILKGGSDAIESNKALYKCIKEAFDENKVDSKSIQLIEIEGHDAINELLKQDKYIDVVIPRGGKELIENVVKNSRIQVIKHFEGVCNIFIDEAADLSKAIDIVINAKVQKPGVCNAVENLIIHEKIAEKFLPAIKEEFEKHNVEMRGCKKTLELIDVEEATDEDFYKECLARIISIKVVGSVEDAILFIDKYGSGHSDAIISEDKEAAKLFLNKVDSAAVYHNASTRFTDGGCFGMGCEIGISTQKLHARGPMGLKEMTSYKYVIEGDGQVRE